jgi:hypothetical protein
MRENARPPLGGRFCQLLAPAVAVAEAEALKLRTENEPENYPRRLNYTPA